ncbi:MAG: hypothetical protein WCK35_29030 [Chloroflexota bacterium]
MERGTRSKTPQKNLFGFWGELPVSKYIIFLVPEFRNVGKIPKGTKSEAYALLSEPSSTNITINYSKIPCRVDFFRLYSLGRNLPHGLQNHEIIQIR